jgi:hypothetical protein
MDYTLEDMIDTGQGMSDNNRLLEDIKPLNFHHFLFEITYDVATWSNIK